MSSGSFSAALLVFLQLLPLRAFAECPGGVSAGAPFEPGAVPSLLSAPLAAAKRSFEQRGFRCSETPTDPGPTLRCLGRISGYGQEVALLVPPGYRPVANPPLITHFRGFNEKPYASLEQTVADPAYLLEQHLAASGGNSIMMVPHAFDKNREHVRDLASRPAQFPAFLRKVTATLKESGLAITSEPGPVTLSGHSGAFVPITKILSMHRHDTRIKRVFLFDSLQPYAADAVAAWVREDPSRSLWLANLEYTYAVKTKRGTTVVAKNGTRLARERLEAELARRGKRVAFASVRKPREATDALIKSYRVGFVTSNASHKGAVGQFLGLFLVRPWELR